MLIAKQEIEMLGVDAIEGTLPMAAAQSTCRFHHVGDANLAKNVIVNADCLFQNAEKGALSG